MELKVNTVSPCSKFLVDCRSVLLNDNDLSGSVPPAFGPLWYDVLPPTYVNVCGNEALLGINADTRCDPSSELFALNELYYTANGWGWKAYSGWLVDSDPCQSWFGISCVNGSVV